MNCVNCGRENPEKALICYWCGRVPATGAAPYPALATPIASFLGEDFNRESQLAVPDVAIPPAIEVPPPLPVPEMRVGTVAMDLIDLSMPELPPLEIAPSPTIPDLDQFTQVRRRRARHRPVVRSAPPRPTATHPALPGLGRVLIFLVGLGVLFLLGSALVTALGAASFGNAFCLAGLLGLAALSWIGLLLARTGRRVATATGAAFERLEVLGKTLREVMPGVVKELPVNLPAQLEVLNMPVAYSELRALSAQRGEPPLELAVDLLTGAVASLVGRDDVVLARRTFPLQVRGLLTQPTSREVSQPVITRRRAYVGPGELEQRIAQTLRTDRPMTIEELMQGLVGPGEQRQVQRLLTWIEGALTEKPPDLEALATPDQALAELEAYRTALRRADPELYKLLEDEIRRALGAVARRSAPSSLLDLARYTSTSSRSRQTQGRRGPQE